MGYIPGFYRYTLYFEWIIEELKLGCHGIEIQEHIKKKELFHFENYSLEYVNKMRK